MWSIKKILEKLGQAVGITPKMPYITGGHRGIAAGSLKKPDLDKYRQRIVTGHTTVSPEEAAQVVYEEQPFFVNSSNISVVQYFKDEKKLMVEFKSGAAYLISDISEKEMIDFIQAQSKGGWYWSNIRIRGTKYGHRKAYIKIG